MTLASFGEGYEEHRVARPAEALRRWVIDLIVGRKTAEVDQPSVPARKLAGPHPGDERMRGYLADLDMEVGF